MISGFKSRNIQPREGANMASASASAPGLSFMVAMPPAIALPPTIVMPPAKKVRLSPSEMGWGGANKLPLARWDASAIANWGERERSLSADSVIKTAMLAQSLLNSDEGMHGCLHRNAVHACLHQRNALHACLYRNALNACLHRALHACIEMRP